MPTYYLAVDLGASSGRHILAHMEKGKLLLEEVHRFDNHVREQNGRLTWDVGALMQEIVTGMKKCTELDKIPASMGIDTWGCDFVLLDQDQQIVGDVVAYRDSRTDGMDAAIAPCYSDADLYARSGIQKHNFNTIYQLFAVKTQTPNWLEAAKYFLFLPNYLCFCLTGALVNEYTVASTSALLKAGTNEWDTELLTRLSLKPEMFCPLALPGTKLGGLTEAMQREVGFDTTVVLPCSHDTASAVTSLPGNDSDRIYISSGTWSLLGIEAESVDCSEAARLSGYTNEGGIQFRHRFLKNIMGLWMIQSVRRELNKKYSFDELETMARGAADFPSLVDVTDEYFTYPGSMMEAIKEKCRQSGGRVPESVAEIMACIYNSLAAGYARAVADLERLTGRRYAAINVIGGGCKDGYLCELTAKATGKTVCAGPSEATSIGNIAVQMLASGELCDLPAAREMIGESFAIKTYQA